MDRNVSECKCKEFLKCWLRTEKLEEVARMNECVLSVVNLISCPFCPQRFEANELEIHWLNWVGNRGRPCKLCEEHEDAGHDYRESAILIEKKPVKD
ncbi:unnamed protein product [Brachionus calyciflorus]|uniref:Uncharacterized protein n=1 Tax=Brachionus calyciflorus TaxID=104777 RepID=A0A814P7Z2_9BILA|nr:unnamed protein product [Brachionus calyciflorus]